MNLKLELHEKNVESIVIETPNGHCDGKLFFVPCDIGIYARVAEAQKEFKNLLEPIPRCGISPSGESTNEESQVLVEDFNANFTRLVNYVCGVDCAEQVFEKHLPLADMCDGNGTFWATCVMDTLIEVMGKIGMNVKETQKTVQKWR